MATAGWEPTSWTRPTQWGAAALLASLAVHLVVAPLIVRYPLTTGFVSVVVVVLVLQVLGMIGSLMGWRWTFWAVAVYFAFVATSAVRDLPTWLTRRPSSDFLALALIEQALGLTVLGFLIWMFIAYRRFGPWAMRRVEGSVGGQSSSAS